MLNNLLHIRYTVDCLALKQYQNGGLVCTRCEFVLVIPIEPKVLNYLWCRRKIRGGCSSCGSSCSCCGRCRSCCGRCRSCCGGCCSCCGRCCSCCGRCCSCCGTRCRSCCGRCRRRSSCRCEVVCHALYAMFCYAP